MDPIPTPSSIAPDLSPQIDEFFTRALERDREKRFRSGLEMATALARALGQRLDALDPTWATPPPGETLPALRSRDGPTASTRVTPEGSADEPTNLTDDITLPVGVAGAQAGASAAPTAPGTLTDMGSLQVEARRAELPRQYLLWVGAGIVVAALGAAGLLMAQDSDLPEPAAPEPAPTEPAPTEPVGEPSFRPAEVVAGPNEPDGADPASTAEPDRSASAARVPPKPRTKPPITSPPPKSKDSFSDRFGYD